MSKNQRNIGQKLKSYKRTPSFFSDDAFGNVVSSDHVCGINFFDCLCLD